MNPFDWIVFDSTGTLMTTVPEPAMVYQSVGQQFGSSLTVEQLRLGLTAALVKNFLGDQSHLPTDREFERGRWRRIVHDTLTDLNDDDAERAYDVLWHEFSDHSRWRLYDDVLPTLRRFRDAGYQLGIASNFDERLRTILSGMGIEDSFDKVLISSELGWSKPNPKFYDLAASRLGQIDRKRLLMIGDTYHGDVVISAQAGWRSRHLVRDTDQSLAELIRDL